MIISIGKSSIEIVKGDITAQQAEAVVNAANPQLTPGGGVSGAIHRAAGRELWEECKKLGGCRPGEAKITSGYKLAKYVIHTVGPIYTGKPEDEITLANCYRNSLKLAMEHGIKSIAFPSISTGIYGYPVEEAARISLETIISFLRGHEVEMEVRIVLYDDRTYLTFLRIADELKKFLKL
ncbi:MAG: macro domain-containing protein [Thermoplasmatales archaeon]|nr:macro domain-containing protein [Thermoplasmatales archaeon]